MRYFYRNLTKKLESTAKTFAATYLNGGRQCGKSTLVRHLLSYADANYLTFDAITIRAAAKKDPDAFIASLPKNKLNIIDEVQRVPAIHLSLKKAVDERRFSGKNKAVFLLTGSANIFGLPKLAKAMVGRMANLTLYPFSAAEIYNSETNFMDKLWNDTLSFKNYKRADLAGTVKDATFPEIALDKDIDRSVWMDSYIDTILDRDAAEFAKIRKPELVYQLLVSLSSRVGNLVNNDNR